MVRFAREQVAAGLFSINRICGLCGISKNTFYGHKHPDESFAAKYGHLKSQIERIIKENCHYGVKRIKAALWNEHKIHVGRDALSRLLRLWRLELRRKNKKAKKSVIKKILISLSDRANLLIRTAITEPFQAITSDITEIYFNSGKDKAYFAVHKDVFGQMVYGWSIKKSMEANLIMDSLKMAKQSIGKLIKRIPNKLLCHQDQGSQYTGYSYVDFVLKSNMRLSYSTPGTPTDNPGQESFFGRLKEECQDEFNETITFKELEKFINKRMKYYNRKRIHTSADYQSPIKFTKLFIKKLSLACR
ncbi:IS3 family transposase [Candidatus Parcubacteria bacterium]|nr:IS3 family transposase [Candidatus Parcubacteria bacterium]